MSGKNWHNLTKEDVFKNLGTTAFGLSSSEARERVEKFGLNILVEEKPPSALKIFLSQFTNILIIILIIAAFISALTGEVKNFIAIIAIVVLNGILGFIQEYKAEKAMEALKAVFPYRAKVIRDGIKQEIEAKYVVPGDIIMIEAGDKIPADAYLTSSYNLETQESALTGESLPSDKKCGALPESTPLAERSNMIFSGTIAVSGSGTAAVLETGMQTQFGNIAFLTQKTKKEKSPLEKSTKKLAGQLGIIILLLSAVIIFTGFLQGRKFLEIFMTGIALAVAVIPEGLPIVVTLTLALGVQKMLKKKCLIRRLTASETIGSASIICTDKTGTLTKNEMTLTEIYLSGGQEIIITGAGYKPEGKFLDKTGASFSLEDSNLKNLIETALLCNRSELYFKDNFWNILGDPTEGALVAAAKKAGVDKDAITADMEFISEVSFTSERKMMSVVYRKAREYFVFVKGAFDVMLLLCTDYYDNGNIRRLDAEKIKFTENKHNKMAESGLRVLSFAYKKISPENLDDEKKIEKGLVFLGIAGMLDPPRDEAKKALRTAFEAGIRVSIVTGDSLLTTRAVAKKLGLERIDAYEGKDLDKLSDKEITDILDKPFSIFARTTPEHKLKITRILQQNNQIVAMTGDGINDAPAIKKADVGIAMGIKGTDVAKQTADIVLMDDNFASIVDGNEEGRRQYDNIKKFTQYLLSCNIGEAIAIGGSIFLNLPLILLPIQILWMNFITDGVGSLTLGLEKTEPDIMKRPPRKYNDPILSKNVLIVLVLIGLYEGLAVLGLFKYALCRYDLTYSRTLAFTCLILIQLINIFNFRSLKFPLYRIGFFGNMWLMGAFAVNILLQACVVYMPFLQGLIYTTNITLNDWLLLFVISAPLLIVGELVKIFYLQNKK